MPLHEYPDKGFYEAEHSERVNVETFFRHAIAYREWISTEPMCFVDEINLMQIIATDDQSEMRSKLDAAILEDRKCPGWYPYMPGLSPQEHYQDRQMRDYERKMEDERIAREVSYRRQDRMFVIAALILAAGQIVAAIIVSRESLADQLIRKLLGQ